MHFPLRIIHALHLPPLVDFHVFQTENSPAGQGENRVFHRSLPTAIFFQRFFSKMCLKSNFSKHRQTQNERVFKIITMHCPTNCQRNFKTTKKFALFSKRSQTFPNRLQKKCLQNVFKKFQIPKLITNMSNKCPNILQSGLDTLESIKFVFILSNDAIECNF